MDLDNLKALILFYKCKSSVTVIGLPVFCLTSSLFATFKNTLVKCTGNLFSYVLGNCKAISVCSSVSCFTCDVDYDVSPVTLTVISFLLHKTAFTKVTSAPSVHLLCVNIYT